MFKVNDYVVYGNKGVCQIDSIGTLDMNGIDKDRLYYTLSYVFEKKGQLYSPVDSTKVTMRHVLNKETLSDLIESIPSITPLLSLTERVFESVYKAALKTCDSKEIIRLIKTIHSRQEYRLSQSKKINQVEERYLRSAEDLFFGEVAIVLGPEKNMVPSYLMKQLHMDSITDVWTTSPSIE